MAFVKTAEEIKQIELSPDARRNAVQNLSEWQGVDAVAARASDDSPPNPHQ